MQHHTLMKTPTWALGLALLAAAPAVQAIDPSNGLAASARQARREAGGIGILKAKAEPGPTMTLTVGLAHDKDEADTRVTAVPFTFDYRTAGDNWWKFRLQGGGYTRITAPGATTLDGLADLQLSVHHPLGGGFTGTVGLDVPTRGEVGSTAWGQTAALTHVGELGGPWTTILVGALSRTNATTPGVSKLAKTLYAEVDYAIGQGTVLVSLARSQRGGAGGATDIGLGYDHSISRSLGLTLTLARGLSQGARHTGISLDLYRTF